MDCLLNQTYPNLEVIVADDGSTDGTKNVLEWYIGKEVKVVVHENKEQCAAANLAFRHATRDYIKFFDADDILSPDFIEAQRKRIQSRTNIVASASWGCFNNDDMGTFKLCPEQVWKDMSSFEWNIKSFKDGPNMMHCALWLIPRAVLEKSGWWNEALSLINDFEFFIRVLLAAYGSLEPGK